MYKRQKLAGIQKDYKESEKTFQTLESEYVVHPDGAGALWQDGTRIQFEALRKENPEDVYKRQSGDCRTGSTL